MDESGWTILTQKVDRADCNINSLEGNQWNDGVSPPQIPGLQNPGINLAKVRYGMGLKIFSTDSDNCRTGDLDEGQSCQKMTVEPRYLSNLFLNPCKAEPGKIISIENCLLLKFFKFFVSC